MQVETLGDGRPEVAVVGGIHGDEPCGWRAVEALLEDPPAVRAPVKLVVANELAIERGVRYVDRDLNRAFPGPDAGPDFEYGDDNEGVLARELAAELRGCLVLSLHSTQSYADPFALVGDPTSRELGVIARIPVDAVVDCGPFVEGRPLGAFPVIEVECGRQGSERAAENAVRVVDAFLRATGVLEEPRERRDVPHFELFERIPKPDGTEYEVFAENFQQVAAGEAYAATDGRRHCAECPFVPVLLSANGYEDQFGYAARETEPTP